MKRFGYSLIILLSLTPLSCSRDTELSRGVEGYDVVEEGSASGVTGSLVTPGETLPGLTGTNVDTTTDLAILDTAATSTSTAPDSLSETLPGTSAPVAGRVPSDTVRPPRSTRRDPSPAPPTAQPSPDSGTSPARAAPAEPAPQPEREPEPAPAPPTQTAEPLPPQREPPQPSPPTSTEPAPPPPTQTTTDPW